jgi:hypothetical protein
MGRLSTPRNSLALRFGEYEIGGGFCPSLHGHPDIIFQF